MLSQSRKKLKSNSANLITLTNLSLGGFSTIAVVNDQPKLALLFILIAALADRFDGAVARKFNVESELGKQLDSLCDLISFGVAPALLIYSVAFQGLGQWGMFASVLFIGCGAYRLARFNVSTCNGYFTGMPIPVAACIIAFFSLFSESLPTSFYFILTCLLSFLMVSTLKMKKM